MRLHSAIRAIAFTAVTGLAAQGATQATQPTQVRGASSAAVPREWLVGMSTALSGPSASLGLRMREGVEAAFAQFNATRGADAPRLRLIALDDGYEPDRCAPNMHALIDEHGVLAVIGNVGTPTAIVAVPIANQSRTPFFGAFTGAGLLRKQPPERYVVNYRASYAEETSAMVDALLGEGGLDVHDVAFFTQRDGYGDSGFSGGLEALERHGLEAGADVVHGRYERNTVAVESGLAELLLARRTPRAVILVGAYKPCAALIQQARAVGFEPLFLNVSFVGANALATELGEQGEGVIVTQVVPHYEADLPIVARYRTALAALDAKAAPNFGSLEGYVCGTIFCSALARVAGEPTRESVVDALLGLGEFDLGLGTPLRLDPQHHQACHQVWPTVLHAGEIVPFDWSELRQRARAPKPQ